MKKNFLALVLALATLNSFAANALEVFQYRKDANGRKIFSRNWTKQTNTGELIFQIISKYKNTSIPDGKYDLGKAKGDGIFSSSRSSTCSVKFSGTIDYSSTGINSGPIRLVLTGEGCRQFYDNFPYKTAHMPLFGVPTVDGANDAKNLTIHIQTNAISECGLVGSLKDRQTECFSINGNLVNRSVSTLKQNSPWSLVSSSEIEGSSWRDNVSGLVWGPASKVQSTLKDAKDICSRNSVLKFISTADQASTANDHGLFNVFPKAGAYWAPVNRTVDDDQVTIYFAHSNGDPSDFFGIVDRTSPLRKLDFHCVNK